jgi:transposase
MKKHITATKNQTALAKSNRKQIRKLAAQQRLTIGLDLGDRSSRYCILDESGEVASEGSLLTTRAGLDSLFAKMPSSRVALEVGTHSPWVSRHLAELGHEAIVANPHKVKLITQSVRKNDRIDARKLARLARVDPQLLSPIRHRGAEAQAELAAIRARAEVMKARTGLINCARGLAKAMGERLKGCDAGQVGASLADGLSGAMQSAIGPLLKSVESLSEQIREYDRRIEQIAQRRPEVELLTAVYGVGTLIGLTYVLTIEDAGRFEHSRDVGCFLGLQPRQRESGESRPELGISKAGDRLLRSYLVQAAHCNLRRGAAESDLRDWGLRKLQSGGKNAKRRVLVAMARKLAVLLHRLWATGEIYDPLYNRKAGEAAAGRGKGKVGGKGKTEVAA